MLSEITTDPLGYNQGSYKEGISYVTYYNIIDLLLGGTDWYFSNIGGDTSPPKYMVVTPMFVHIQGVAVIACKNSDHRKSDLWHSFIKPVSLSIMNK